MNFERGMIMANFIAVFFGILLGLLMLAAVAAVVAFPFMWGWNYAITHVFGAPEIGWGHSFVLLFFLSSARAQVGKAS